MTERTEARLRAGERIRIVALDLDGTLLDSEKRLSEANRAALAAVAAKGVRVVPTTGRFFGMMPSAVRDLPFVRYAITVNGAQVYDRAEDRALVREEIPLATSLAVMELLARYDVIYDCYRNNWGWMARAFKEKAESYATDAHYLKMIREFRKPVEDLPSHLRATASEGDVQKIMLFTRLEAPPAVRDAIAAAVNAAFPALKTAVSTRNNLEINAASAHKGHALARFAQALGLGLENCMAFGDGGNDLTMIRAAGIGVAMANACGDVLSAADDVTASCDEDGVARALAAYGLA